MPDTTTDTGFDATVTAFILVKTTRKWLDLTVAERIAAFERDVLPAVTHTAWGRRPITSHDRRRHVDRRGRPPAASTPSCWTRPGPSPPARCPWCPADLGIAIGSGADAALHASDLTLVRGDLGAAVDAVRLARRMLAVVYANLFWAFAYNLLALPIAAMGLLNPMIACAAMSLSSVFVVTNSLRLRRFS